MDKEAAKNCPNSAVTVNAPLFGWSAESNEILAISQTQTRLQLVEQMICDEEMCRQKGNCRQVNVVYGLVDNFYKLGFVFRANHLVPA